MCPQLSESEFAAQARVAAGNVGKAAQAGAMTAQERFNKFVEGGEDQQRRQGQGQGQALMDDGKKAFWDDFAAAADQRQPKHNSVGTSAMRGGNKSGAAPAKKDDEWDDW